LPGKIHHEFEGAYGVNGRQHLATTYNRCDTTGLFLIGTEALVRIDPELGYDFLRRRIDNLRAAVQYIIASTGADNLFWDTPPPGADGYALMVTYWKDTQLPRLDGKKEPMYSCFICSRALYKCSSYIKREHVAK